MSGRFPLNILSGEKLLIKSLENKGFTYFRIKRHKQVTQSTNG